MRANTYCPKYPRLQARMASLDSISSVEKIFNKYDPESLFTYNFIDQEYARNFLNEERMGKLATFFALLAICISCLGIFGLSAFVAEQRTKEIGIRA